MELSQSVTVMLKCAVISKYGYKPSKRVIKDFLAQHSASTGNSEVTHLVRPFLEYIRTQCRLCTTDDSDKIRATFLAFDTKGQGCISKTDLISVANSVVPSFKESQVEHLFRQIDTDNDGCVTYKDFERMMMFDPSNGS